MIRYRPIASLVAVLVFGTASTPDANAQRAVVEGVARAEDSGASIREGLLARYRFRSLLREESLELLADGPTPVYTLDQPIISDPRWALRNAARIRDQRLKRGYYGPNDGWSLPNELDVLHEDFLRTHCLDASAQHGDGEIGLRFQPLRMPVGGAFAMRPSRKNPAKRTEGKLTFSYSGFEDVPPR